MEGGPPAGARVALYGSAAVELPAGAEARAEGGDLVVEVPAAAAAAAAAPGAGGGAVRLRVRPLCPEDDIEVHVEPPAGGLLGGLLLGGKRAGSPAGAGAARAKVQRRMSEFAKRADYDAAGDPSAGLALRWELLGVAPVQANSGVSQRGDQPAARSHGAAAFCGATGRVLVHGGEAGAAGCSGDLWAMAPRPEGAGADAGGEAGEAPAPPGAWEWERVGSGAGAPRAAHTAVLAGDKLVAFGGRAGRGEAAEALNDVELYDSEAGLWFPAFTTGESPRARFGHSATVLDSGNLLVFGGCGADGRWLNDVHVLDTALFNWYKPGVKGAPPKGRAGHSAVVAGGRIVVFGGAGRLNWQFKEVHTLDPRTWKWTEHTANVDGEPPSSRVGQVAVAAPDGRHIVVVGGTEPDDDGVCFDDVSVLDTARWRWLKPDVRGAPPKRGHPLSVALKSDDGKTSVVLFGGQAPDGTKLGDAWALRL